MPNQDNERDQRNDKRLLTPLLVMAVIVLAAIVIYSYTGHASAMAIGMTG